MKEQSQNTPPRPSKKAKAVLIVEDESTVRKSAKSILTDLGFNVFKARDSVEALKVFQKHKDSICCILCDVSQPGSDGWKTVSVLRYIKRRLPVIITSTDIQAQIKAGDHYVFLGKPYGLVELGEAINLAFETATRQSDPVFRPTRPHRKDTEGLI